MKAVSPNTLRLGKYTVQMGINGQIRAYDGLGILGLNSTPQTLEKLVHEHGLEMASYNFGKGPEPCFSLGEFSRLAFLLDTPEARRWQMRSQELLRGYLEGNVQLAAEIAERNPDPAYRHWLAARLESTETRKRFMSAVARYGGEGQIFQQVSSLSNQAVLKMNSSDFRKQRKVKSTRDGMTSTELLRLSYLETATARALEKQNLKGNQVILRLHQRNAEIEGKIWEEA
jgi:hypothetical protein